MSKQYRSVGTTTYPPPQKKHWRKSLLHLSDSASIYTDCHRGRWASWGLWEPRKGKAWAQRQVASLLQNNIPPSVGRRPSLQACLGKGCAEGRLRKISHGAGPGRTEVSGVNGCPGVLETEGFPEHRAATHAGPIHCQVPNVLSPEISDTITACNFHKYLRQCYQPSAKWFFKKIFLTSSDVSFNTIVTK